MEATNSGIGPKTVKEQAADRAERKARNDAAVEATKKRQAVAQASTPRPRRIGPQPSDVSPGTGEEIPGPVSQLRITPPLGVNDGPEQVEQAEDVDPGPFDLSADRSGDIEMFKATAPVQQRGAAWVDEPENTPETPSDLEEYITLEKENRKIKDRQDAIKKRMATLSTRLLDEWADSGQTNAKIQGFTVFVANKFWCSKRTGVAMGDLCDVLKKEGLGRLVAEGYAPSGLKSWIKEQIETDGAEVPDNIKAIVNFDTKPTLGVRKA